MSEEDWKKAKEILDDAMKLAPENRPAFLDKVCGDNESLRREVESLLASSENIGSFMEQAAIVEVADIIESGSKKLGAGKSFGHYEIIKQIGVGGMGEVFLAQDKKLDRKVAVKILNEKFAKHKSNLQRFIQEAKSASALNHPNILTIYEIGESENAHYIVSEYIEGKTLREVLQKQKLELVEVLDVAIQIAGALIAAHNAKIVHRDIKPENIVLRPDGLVKILDFGLAKLIEQKAIGTEDQTIKQNETAKGIILGTVNYMSPEQAKGERVDERTDIFSFGAVLYEMIAGRTPFAGDSISETFANLIKTEPNPLSDFVANVPDELQRIIAKTLRKKADERYQTMKGLLGDLKVLQENLASIENLEKSQSADDKNATAVLPAATTSETKRSFNGWIKRNKLLAALAAVLLTSTVGLTYYFYNAGKSVSGGKKSLAVLPFVNAGQDPNAEYLSDGIAESLINRLSQLSNLRVMSRNSAFRFKNNQTDTKNIAAELNVENLVTGDIKQLGDKLIINVRLIDASEDSQIWGHEYVKTSTDIIAVQNEIAQAVVQNLRVKLSNSEQQQMAKRPTENAEAYQLYLRGRFHVFKLTPPETQKGISYLQQAIELDSSFALAYVGISDAYRSFALGSEMSPTEFLPKSKAAANKAIELDDSLSEAHTALGSTLFWQWNWNESENQFKRALELNPNEANVHIFYAHFLSNTGRHAEALAEIKRARELDPLVPFAGALEGQFLLHAGRPDEALDRLKKTFELAPNFWMPHLFAASVYTEKGMFEEAVAEARKARELSPALTISVAIESYALAKSGKNDEARILLNELLKLSETRFVPPTHIALIYNGLGETDKTFEWLEKGYQQRDPKMAFLKVEPKWNNLRGEARFQNLMKRIGFDSTAENTTDINSRLYWQMSDAPQIAFIRERAQYIQTLIGDNPTEFDEGGRGNTERSFWGIFRHRSDLQLPLPDNGKRYVPRFFAAAIIGETPKVFELSTPPLTTLR